MDAEEILRQLVLRRRGLDPPGIAAHGVIDKWGEPRAAAHAVRLAEVEFVEIDALAEEGFAAASGFLHVAANHLRRVVAGHAARRLLGVGDALFNALEVGSDELLRHLHRLLARGAALDGCERESDGAAPEIPRERRHPRLVHIVEAEQRFAVRAGQHAVVLRVHVADGRDEREVRVRAREVAVVEHRGAAEERERAPRDALELRAHRRGHELHAQQVVFDHGVAHVQPAVTASEHLRRNLDVAARDLARICFEFAPASPVCGNGRRSRRRQPQRGHRLQQLGNGLGLGLRLRRLGLLLRRGLLRCGCLLRDRFLRGRLICSRILRSRLLRRLRLLDRRARPRRLRSPGCLGRRLLLRCLLRRLLCRLLRRGRRCRCRGRGARGALRARGALLATRRLFRLLRRRLRCAGCGRCCRVRLLGVA